MDRLTIAFIVIMTFLWSCSSSDHSSRIDAKQFSEKMAATASPQLIDVRTPDEFMSGHLAGAKNLVIDTQEFEAGLDQLDKSKPVFVYCLSGGRSAATASILAKKGFKEVYDLENGLIGWQSGGYGLESGTSASANKPTMTLAELKQLSAGNKTILVDFYADWCGPCKKMEPILNEIATEMGEKVQVVRVDIDANPEIAKELNIESIPFLQIYKNQQETWSNVGLTPKEMITQNL